MRKEDVKVLQETEETPRKRSRGNYKTEPDCDFMQSLARGLTVMQTFSQHKRHLSVSQISSQTDISRAAVRRCMHTLVQLGYAGTHDEQHYFLRAKVLSLSQGYFASTPLAKIAQPILERLSATINESCSVATLESFEVFYVARAAASRIMSVDLHVGSRLPAFCTSMGRVLLANMPPAQLKSFLASAILPRYTSRTVTAIPKLMQVLETVKRNGYAIVDQELEIGLRSIAVPIRNSNSDIVVAALNVGCHAQRVNLRDMHSKFLPALREAAAVIGERI